MEESLAPTLKSLLGKARRAWSRFEKGEEDGLHDFRVSVRRLHTLLKAFRKSIKGKLPKKQIQGLKAIIAASNRSRDQEVWLAWLEAHKERLEPQAAQTLEREIARLRSRLNALRRRIRFEFRRPFQDLCESLRTHCRLCRVRAGTAKEMVQEYSQEVRRRLSRLESERQKGRIHKARISVKRLRYLLEPLAGAPDLKKAVEDLRSAQGILGQIHDLHVFSAQAIRIAPEELPRLMKEERRSLFETLRKTCLKRCLALCRGLALRAPSIRWRAEEASDPWPPSR